MFENSITLLDIAPLIMIGVALLLTLSGAPSSLVLGGVGVLTALVVATFDPETKALSLLHNLPELLLIGVIENFTLLAILPVILMGLLLKQSGSLSDTSALLQILLRIIPDGSSLSYIVVAPIVASTTGEAEKTLSERQIGAPHRDRSDQLQQPRLAGSALGLLLPPSLALIIAADSLDLAPARLFAAAAAPFLIMFASFALVMFSRGFRSSPPFREPLSLPTGGRLFTVIVFGISPIALIIVVGLITVSGAASLLEATSFGAALALVIFVSRTVTSLAAKQALNVAAEASRIAGSIVATVVGALVFGSIFFSLGGFRVFSGSWVDFSSDPWSILCALLVCAYVLGIKVGEITALAALLPIFAPTFLAIDFGDHLSRFDTPEWIAILMIMSVQFSSMTRFCRVSVRAWPFALIAIAALAIVTAYPDIVVGALGLATH